MYQVHRNPLVEPGFDLRASPVPKGRVFARAK